MQQKEENSIKIKYFLLGLFTGWILIPKITKSTIGSHNGNNYFFITKKEDEI